MPTAVLADRNAKMAILRRQFLARVSTEVEAIKGLVNQMDDAGSLTLRSLCHMLKDSAAILGFHALMNSAVILHREILERPQDKRSIMDKWACLLGDIQRSEAEAS